MRGLRRSAMRDVRERTPPDSRYHRRVQPVAFTLHWFAQPIVFYSYGLMLATGSVAGGLVALRAAQRIGVDFGRTIAALAIVALGGGVGGWAFQTVVYMIDGVQNGALVSGSRAVVGSLLGGLGALILAKRVVPTWRFADAAVPAAPLAQAMGRLGCFFGGCCYGAEWHGPWAVVATTPDAAEALHVSRHPWPLYESAADLAIAALLLFWPWSSRPGVRTAAYFALYAAARLALEPLRGDPDRGVYFGGATSASQIACAVILPVAVGVIWRARTLAAAPAT